MSYTVGNSQDNCLALYRCKDYNLNKVSYLYLKQTFEIRRRYLKCEQMEAEKVELAQLVTQ